MRRFATAASMMLILAACAPTTPTASPVGSPQPGAIGSPASTDAPSPPTVAPSATATAAPGSPQGSPPPEPPARREPIHLASLTRLCGRFPTDTTAHAADEDPLPRLWCGTALKVAARMVPDGIDPWRAWFGYGTYCAPGADCVAVKPARNLGWVVFEDRDAAFLVAVAGTGRHPVASPIGLTEAPAGPGDVPSPDARAPELPHHPPIAIAGREPLPFCGWIEPYGSAPTADAIGCFVRRVTAGLPAELIETYPTTEGDPITDVLRYTGSGGIRVAIDATQDSFGSGRWERASCGLVLLETGDGVVLEDCRDRDR